MTPSGSANGGLELTEDPRFQRREWRAQDVGRALLALLLVATAAGALGGAGPLARATAHSADGRVTVEHARFAREHRSTELRVRVDPPHEPGPVELRFDRRWLDRFRVEELRPEPGSTVASSSELLYRFEAPPPGEALEVVFELVPRRAGRGVGALAVGSRTVALRDFVYP